MATEGGHVQEPKNFAPKQPVQLDPPKDDPITRSELEKHNGDDPSKPILVAIKGTVFDVSGNKAYNPGGQYHGMLASSFHSFITTKRPGPTSCADIYRIGTVA